MPRTVRGSARDGFILVAVLGVMGLLAALAGVTALLVRSAVDGARTGRDDLVLDALVRAGVELGAYELYALKLPPERIDGQQIRLDDGVVTLFVTDEGGKIDINGSDPALLASVYRNAGLAAMPAEDFAGRVVGSRDRPDERTARLNAEESPAGAQGQQAQNDAFRSVEDLQWLPGVAPEDVARLAGAFTVHNPAGRVNVRNASREVLLALPGVSAGTVEQIAALRGLPPDQSTPRLTQLLQKQQQFVRTEPGPTYRLRVEVRRGASARRSAEVAVTRSRSPDALYHVVEWRE